MKAVMGRGSEATSSIRDIGRRLRCIEATADEEATGGKWMRIIYLFVRDPV
jgi:hypothetical protein